MGFLDRLLRGARRTSPDAAGSPVSAPATPVPAGGGADVSTARPEAEPVDDAREAAMWERLREDPNDVAGFAELADIVRRRAGESDQGEEDPQRAADDAVWSLAEELAHSGRAWYPLIELARLSIRDDREAALRRLETAADRDAEGDALATGVAMLREERMPGDALNLAVGHWRPREHVLAAGRQVVEAAIEAGRVGDARRHLSALQGHPDTAGAEQIRSELAPLIDRAEAQMPPGTPAGGIPLIDLRELREESSRNPFRRP